MQEGMQRLINGWALLLTCTVYVGILFAIARWGDQEKRRGLTAKWRGVVYSLALAVYCTSWTFYGAVGSAAQDGWLFLPIYLGPMLIICLGWPLIERIVAISRRQRLTTIADFIAARYGKSRGLGVLVTVIATIGSIPYIALQLKAVTNSFTVTSGIGSDTAAGTDLAIVVTAALAGFAILFGTRKVDITEHHDGVMFAIAFESVIKLVAFVAVGIFALTIIGSPAPDMLRGVQFGDVFALDGLPNTFLTQLLLASAAIFCLPRQFHVAIVEARADASINMARWVFPAYLAVFSVLVVPITLAGLSTLQASSISADSYVLALPMNAGLDWLTLLAFIGGFSAATGMVIVACIALSTMISNEIVVPLLVRLRAMQSTTHNDYPWLILNARRLAIVAIAALAFVYYSLTDSNTALASIGLLSFAAAAQFAPLILLGVYWRRAHRVGALSGLAVGFVLWGYTLFLPTLASAGAISDEFIREGLFGIEALRPEALVFDLGSDPLTHGVAWSLIMNVLVMVVASLVCKQTMIERSQARTFAGLPALQDNLTTSAVPGVSQNDLRELAARFVGREHAQRSFADFNAAQRRDNSAQSGASVLRFTEKLLAGAIGAASARVVMTSALRHRGSDIGDVLLLLDETSEAIRFNRQLVEATLENMTQGVSVVDAEQRLVGWNRRYLELMDYDENLVHVGQ
ncbi:MAG: PAS-domain containing protein, partial [Pseudomonadota bacterium]